MLFKTFLLKLHKSLQEQKKDFIKVVQQELNLTSYKVPLRLSGKERRQAGKGKNFFDSRKWQELRYETLVKFGNRCMSCGSIDGPLHVDHIKPRATHPQLELDPDNLQVLCRDCNFGKGARHSHDFRTRHKTRRR